MARDLFEQALAKTLVHEGGYVNHPADPGGATMKGVTQAVYDGWRDRHNLPRQSVRKISELELREIYRRQYWNVIRGDDLPRGLDYVVFDGAVNSGPKQSALWLQRALGNVRADGQIGEATLRACRDHPNHDELVAKICAIRLGFLRRLKTWRHFGKGWTSRVAGVKRAGQAWAAGERIVADPEPAEGGGERASERDLDRPSATSENVADAAIGGGTLTTTLSEATQQLEPIAHTSDVVGWIFAALTIAGIVLVVGGFALRWYNRRKEHRARRAADGLERADLLDPEAAL